MTGTPAGVGDLNIGDCVSIVCVNIPPWSRFKLNVSAGSQKRTIHKPEGKEESRFSLKSKRNINVTIVKYILSLLGKIVSLLGRAFGRCVQNDSVSICGGSITALFPLILDYK